MRWRRSERIARAKIRRKAKVYTPIRAELIELRDAQREGRIYSVWSIQREEVVHRTLRPQAEFWRWKALQEDGRGATAVSTRVAELLDAVDDAADEFNAASARAKETIKREGERILRELGTAPRIQNWVDVDFEHIIRGDDEELSAVEGPGTPPAVPPERFRWALREDPAVEPEIAAVTTADQTLAAAIDAAITELDRAMKGSDPLNTGSFEADGYMNAKGV